ncbi:hypothetical protein FDP41_002387 [Naegleria fowleri]|uniref:Glycosyltransferase 61 catalytic domain-containing protein n=1 Tax=Naegleria fowleri TaxID=5763 RepID=A0A6A5BND9_NAEFO|nr:uncharacterized protein FDP41_002387 [Naegleria fowleri]KAF0978567.1 hypothetical protein FDP41_002387 [Naegleria fowleri]
MKQRTTTTTLHNNSSSGSHNNNLFRTGWKDDKDDDSCHLQSHPHQPLLMHSCRHDDNNEDDTTMANESDESFHHHSPSTNSITTTLINNHHQYIPSTSSSSHHRDDIFTMSFHAGMNSHPSHPSHPSHAIHIHFEESSSCNNNNNNNNHMNSITNTTSSTLIDMEVHSPTSSSHSSLSEGVDLALDTLLHPYGCCDSSRSSSSGCRSTTTTTDQTPTTALLFCPTSLSNTSINTLTTTTTTTLLSYLYSLYSFIVTKFSNTLTTTTIFHSSFWKDKTLAFCIVCSFLLVIGWSIWLLKINDQIPSMRTARTQQQPTTTTTTGTGTPTTSTTTTSTTPTTTLKQPPIQKQPFTNYDQYYLQDDGMEHEISTLHSHSGLFCTHHVASSHFRSCLVYNLCYRNGSYLYFNSRDVTTHYPVEFDLQGLESKRIYGSFELSSLEGRTKSEDPNRGKLLVQAFSQSIQEYQQEHSISDIHWIHKRSVLLKRHRCSNAAHCLLETIYPTFALLKEFFDLHPLMNVKEFVDNYLIFAEQEDEECDCEKDMLTCGTEEGDSKKKQKLCKKFVTQYGKIISKHPNQLIREFTKGHEMVCWESVLMGGSSYGLFNDHGWNNVGGMVKEFRDFTYARFGTVMRTPKTILLKEKVLNVRINVKTGMRTYLRNILNADKLVELAKRDFKTFYHKKSNTIFRVDFQSFVFDNMTIEDKVQYMQDTDVFIAPFGSASYESVFLSSGAVLFTFPDGFPPNKIRNRITDHTLFHSYMHYQNIIYPLESSELEYEKGITIGHYSWSWHKTRLLIARSLNMRLDYLYTVLPKSAGAASSTMNRPIQASSHHAQTTTTTTNHHPSTTRMNHHHHPERSA